MNLKKTTLAIAAAAVLASPAAFAQDNQNADASIDHQHRVNENWDTNVQDIRNNELTITDSRDYDVTVDDTRNYETNIDNSTSNTNTNTNVNLGLDAYANVNADIDLKLDAAAVIRARGDYNESITNTENYYTSESSVTNTVDEDIAVDSNIRREQNEHGRSVYLSKDLSVSSDIAFSGAPTITGDIDLDSAAIAVVDGRQTTVDNRGNNDMLDNDAAIEDDAAAGASGNLGFNVAAGDNNAQDNAAALSAADASFAFGMADAEIFNSQTGGGNVTNNAGVSNDAGIGGNAFGGAAGNISVNVASGNNNAQRNSLAASVATSAYAQASVASDQVSTGNVTNNAGSMQVVQDTIDINLTGGVSGTDGSSASYAGTGAAYQMSNIYPELWGADSNDGNHTSGPRTGHVDMDNDMQGSIDNPNRDGVGGIAFDTDESGVIDMSATELAASLSGTMDISFEQMVAATNSAGLSGSAFSGASGNIGVNVASGTGNLQSNSLSMAVAQPSAATPPTDGNPG